MGIPEEERIERDCCAHLREVFEQMMRTAGVKYAWVVCECGCSHTINLNGKKIVPLAGRPLSVGAMKH